jgi:hypothetical protein
MSKPAVWAPGQRRLLMLWAGATIEANCWEVEYSIDAQALPRPVPIVTQ